MTGPDNRESAEVKRPEQILHSELIAELVEKSVLSAHAVGDRSAEANPSIQVPAEDLPAVIRFMKEQGRANFLDSITGIDFLEIDRSMHDEGFNPAQRFGLIYQLLSIPAGAAYFIRVLLPDDMPAVPSIDSIFGNANWLEREVFDLLGIHFIGSRDLRRILLPEGWDGFPLRRDYVQGETAAGFPTTRPNPTEALKKQFASLMSEGEP